MNNKCCWFTTINIRGTKFDVTNDTLEKMAYFKSLISSNWVSEDNVIDRCPESFRHILDFIMYGGLERCDEFMINKITLDSCYYGVSGIVDRIGLGESCIHGDWSSVRIDVDICALSLIGDYKTFVYQL